MKKPLKITLIIVGAIVAFVLLIALLVSPIATAYVNKNGEKITGRKLTVDRISANILTGHVAIKGLKLYEDDAVTEFVTFDLLDVKARLLRLLVQDVYLSHITLDNPNVRLVQNGSRFNFQSLIDHFKSDDDDEDDDDTPSKWKLYFYNIKLSEGAVQYRDVERGSNWRLKGLNLEVPGFCIGVDQATDAGLSVELADGGRVHADAKYNMESNDFEAVLDLDDVNLVVAKPYITAALNVTGIKGKLDAHLKAQGNLDQASQMDIRGRVDLTDLDLPTKGGNSFASCGRTSVKIDRINIHDKIFAIDSVYISGLAGRFDRYADGNNYTRLSVKKDRSEQPEDEKEEPEVAENNSQEAPSAKPATPSKPLNVTVKHIRVTDSKLTYTDQTLADVFEFPMTAISIETENFSLMGDNNAVVKASLPGGGTLNIRWKGNIMDWKKHQDIMLRIKGLDLTRVSPYSVAYLGRPFTDGTFSFMSHNTVNNSVLEGKNHIDIYKAEVGKKRKDVEAQVKIPFKTALYILKDKDDKILLDVPVKGNVDSPEFSYMKLIWKTLGNLFVKVATSPIRAIGEAMGIGDSPDFIKIEPQQRDFNSEQYHQFGELAKIVKGSENIRLVLEQQVDSTSDEQMLERYARRNEIVLQYMTGHEGVSPEQVSVSTTMMTGLKQSGYAVSSETREEIFE
ncbi:MAG: DUF748 domain-containing protein [Bacteroidales bacterium]|nr:DUF748 domain-containing protein [Bacteroidales bacterium]